MSIGQKKIITTPKSITLSVKILCISTRYFGQPCLKAQDLEPQLPSMRMASWPSMARKWVNLAAPLSKPIPTYKTLTLNTCVTTLLANYQPVSKISILTSKTSCKKSIQTWWVKSSISLAAVQDLSIKIMAVNWHWQSASLLWCNKSLMRAKTSLPLMKRANLAKPCVWLWRAQTKPMSTSMTKNRGHSTKSKVNKPKYKRCVPSRLISSVNWWFILPLYCHWCVKKHEFFSMLTA